MDERMTPGRQQTDPQSDAAVTVPGEPSMAGVVAVDAAAGAAAGAVAGIIAGPPGIAVGAVIGGVVAAAAGVALGKASKEERLHDEQLDREIGVSGGNVGEASLGQPEAAGRLHAASLGISEGSVESSDGPMQNVGGTGG